MTDSDISLLGTRNRSKWIRLRTMILLRWFAIAGQLTAIFVAQYLYGLQLELGLCFLAVGVSVIGNMVAIFVFPENKRLSETENLLMVMFDLLQLCFLLYLTGGLHNPFSLLVLAPVTVSAAVLSLRSTFLLGFTAFALVTGMVYYHLPLRTEQGFILRIPDIFVYGQWAAICIALVFISVYSRRITREMNSMSDALAATQMALARAQKLNDLGGVVAAAAHELGTPLATIKLIASELVEELNDRPDLQQDARALRDSAERCGTILRSMGRAGKDDLHMRHAPLIEVIREAAEPHLARGREVVFAVGAEPEATGSAEAQPVIHRRPEIVHGLRNLIQNAVDFAGERVEIDLSWTRDSVMVTIEDDGPGFPPGLIDRIGDPFMRSRRRPGYEGMGLGLFIAKTLLERSGAELRFANGPDSAPKTDTPVGAVVKVTWPREKLDAHHGETPLPTGENTRFT